jgi:hypothetical protein
MKLEHEIIIHTSDEAKAEWEKREQDRELDKNKVIHNNCPSCEIAELKEKRKSKNAFNNDYINDSKGE